LQGNWRLDTTTVVYCWRQIHVMTFWGGVHFIASAPGRRKP